MANTKRSLKILYVHARTKYIHTHTQILTQSEIESKREHEWRWTITKEKKTSHKLTKRKEKKKTKTKTPPDTQKSLSMLPNLVGARSRAYFMYYPYLVDTYMGCCVFIFKRYGHILFVDFQRNICR